MEKDIGKIKKNDSTDIIIRIDDYGGKKGLTIREFTTTDRYTGFTKSGTRIPAELFKDFRTLINSIYDDDIIEIKSETKSESDVESSDSVEPEPELSKPKKSKKKSESVSEEAPKEELF